MNIGAVLKSFIYLISSSLLYPVLFLLSALSIWILVQAGTFLAEWLARSRLTRMPPEGLPQALKEGKPEAPFSHHVQAYLRSLRALLAKREPVAPDSADEAVVENLLQEDVSALWRSLDRTRMLVRIGPGLGLAGTLIPLGTGLAALGQGDLTRLSSDLVIAFTTTVVGLTVGMLAYFFHTIRRRWVEEDARAMEFITEILVQQHNGEQKNEIHEKQKRSS